jgi:hypothetical protein
MALRAGWGRQPQFVLAIGGFHPRFAPPPGLPALQRLALQLADGDSLQLRCQAYLAVTSNTVQFGARVDLHAAGGGFSFDGMLGFDAILQLAPLAFRGGRRRRLGAAVSRPSADGHLVQGTVGGADALAGGGQGQDQAPVLLGLGVLLTDIRQPDGAPAARGGRCGGADRRGPGRPAQLE